MGRQLGLEGLGLFSHPGFDFMVPSLEVRSVPSLKVRETAEKVIVRGVGMGYVRGQVEEGWGGDDE